MRDSESKLQELRSKIAGYEETQRAYQVYFSVWVCPASVGPAGRVSHGDCVRCCFCLIAACTLCQSAPSLMWMSGLRHALTDFCIVGLCVQEEATRWRQRCDELQTKYGSVDLTEHQRVVAETQRMSSALQARTMTTSADHTWRLSALTTPSSPCQPPDAKGSYAVL